MAKDDTPYTPETELSEMQRYVTQQRGTEPPYSGKLLHNKHEGIYHCLVCQAPLFLSETKYDSGCGWPSFYQPTATTQFATLKMTLTVCNVLKFVAVAAIPTWDTCSRMARSPVVSASASTQLR
jgi:hypothetical protein